MITLTFQFTDIASAAALLAKLNGHEAAAIVPPKAEAPGKPAKASAAPTAPSPRTAEAAPSQPAPSAAAPAPSPEATPPAAPAASASPTADETKVTYPDLQKAVLALHKADPTKAVPIAKSLGADTFKALPEDKWPEALRLVNEAIESLKVA